MLGRYFLSSVAASQGVTRRSLTTSAIRRRKLDSWEEVELNRPMAPTLEGYTRPDKAPKVKGLGEHRFRQFMNVKPPKLSGDTWVNIALVAVLSTIVGIFWYTSKILRPDDFEWIEEERARLEAAKRKINRLMEKKKREEEAAAAAAAATAASVDAPKA